MDVKEAQGQVLSYALVGRDYDIKQQSEQLLLEHKNEWVFEQLLLFLRHDDAVVRLNAAAILGEWQDLRAIPHLLFGLRASPGRSFRSR